ncbi:sel-1 homolog 3 [Pelobates cultripes]|uniref:Sel-1 homolog 3 n=1 Tax=Pelobates cultripes TaxID=61616 RepID=A0AAD1WA91_PELCU|nr:sel-1 homolog 3 [Pelobates cultripes]
MEIPCTHWLDPRTPLFLICMVPLLCFAKETTCISKETKQPFLYEDFVRLHNLPKYAADSDISVEYMCTRPCTIHVDIMASSEFKTGILVFKKRWKNKKYLRATRTRTVSLVFPSITVYRTDYFSKNSIDVYYSVVRAWVVHNDNVRAGAKYSESILNATAKTFAVLEQIPLLQRPYRNHQICLSWYFEVTWMKREHSFFTCPYETDAVKVLDFPLASSSEHNGIIMMFNRFRNRELELRRQQLTDNNAKFTFSAWIFLLDFCPSKECGIIHHVDSKKMYTTPLLFLNQKGQVHVQVQLVTGVDVAMLANLQIPLYKWFRLDMTVYGRKIMLATHIGTDLQRNGHQTFNVADDIYFDDTSGFMVLGGSKYVLGIDGFFGPVKYYRLRTLEIDEISNPLLQEGIYQLIAGYYQRCATAQDIVRYYSDVIWQIHESQTEDTSKDDYIELYSKHGRKTTCPGIPWKQEERQQFSHLINFLKSIDLSDSTADILLDLGRDLYESSLNKLPFGVHHLGTALPSLVDASCLGYHKASYLLAVMNELGLGVPIDPDQGLLYSLVGAQASDRLALLKLGYSHFQGINNYPVDYSVSYAYYMSIAKKTPKDRWTKHEQAYVEAIRLMDDDMLKEQTREDDDLFLWLKQNAERGDARAQHRLAQMYFWGQQGVTKNTDAAVQWYERGALENNDPVLMYDYAILLFKGDAVPKNKKLALKLMKKSAAKGQNEALNGLGWYYHTFRKDYVKAAKYWKKAYIMGNADAAFNLGIMHLNGIYPGEPEINETRAYELITRASEGGHIEGTIHLAQYLFTGSLKGVARDPEAAIRWAKIVAEQNGLIGHVIRKALNAFLDGSLNEAFLYYALTAEAGIEVAQTNLAYICEEIPELTRLHVSNCVWRYYNFSVHQNNPSSFALLKMGDLYYFGSRKHPRNVDLSVRHYTQAALQGEAQGYYNLAQLLQEGISIPERFLQYLEIDQSFYGNNESLVMELYERCQSHSNEEVISPCSLVLLYQHVTAAWKLILHSAMIYVLGSFILSLAVTVFVRCIHVGQEMSESSENSNNMSDGENRGSSALAQSNLELAGLQRWYVHRWIQTMEQTLRRHREWLMTALFASICMVYVSFLMQSV